MADFNDLSPDMENSELVNDSQNQDTGNEFVIPDKLKGKTAEEIARMYVESEQMAHQSNVKAADSVRGLEALRGQINAMQDAINARNAPAANAPPDPFAALAEEVEAKGSFDAGAVRNLGRAISDTFQRFAGQTQANTLYNVHQAQTSQLQDQLMRENPEEWAQRQQDIAQLAPRYASIVRPEFINSPQFLQLLDYASQGANRRRYEDAAVSKAKTRGKVVNGLKGRSFSESGGGAGQRGADLTQYGSTEDFSAASADKQKEVLEKMRQELIRQQSMANSGV